MARRTLKRAARARAGFSMAEMCLAASILSVLLLASTEVGLSAGDAYDAAAHRTERRLEAQRGLESALTALTGAAPSVSALMVPEPPPGGSSDLAGDVNGPFGAADVYFERATAFDPVTGQVIAAQRQQLRLRLESGELPNGIDDDGDGLADEGELVLIANPGAVGERERVLAKGVAPLGNGEFANAIDDDGDGVIDEPGFCVQRIGELLAVQLTLLGLTEGETAPFAVEVASRTTIRD